MSLERPLHLRSSYLDENRIGGGGPWRSGPAAAKERNCSARVRTLFVALIGP